MIEQFHIQVYPQGNGNTCSCQWAHMYMGVYSSIIYNNLLVEMNHMPINGLMEKGKVVYLHKGVLFSNKKVSNTDIRYLDKP